MKRIIAALLFIGFIVPAFAGDIPGFKYKDIGLKSKISYSTSTGKWSEHVNKGDKYFVKSKGFGKYFDYLDENKSFAFSTDCEYEFIAGDLFIGYSNKDMKFYNFSLFNGKLVKRELSQDEMQSLLPEYKVIKMSEFSQNTNSIKVKKGRGDLKILLINDTNKNFSSYTFTSGNAEIETYPMNGILKISSTGMVQFASRLGTSSENPWYVILVR